MSALLLALLLGADPMPIHRVGDTDQRPDAAPQSRTEAMPFGRCLVLADDVAEAMQSNPVTILRTNDVRIVKIEAPDGVVILTCNRPEGRMVLTKRPR